MNSKHLLCLSIAAVVSANAMAFEIQKGKLISQKQWKSDGIVALFSVKNKPVMPTLNIGNAMKSDSASYNIVANVTPLNATVGNPVDIYTYNNVFLLNISDSEHSYRVDYDVCVELPDHMTRCAYSYKQFTVENGGSFSDFDSPGLQPTFSAPGTYKVRTTTMLSPDSGPIIGEAISEAMITVS